MNMFFRIFFVYNVFIITFTGLTTGEVGEKCEPSDDVFDGICTVITDCEVAIRAIRKNNFHNFKRCGFEGAYEIVCCPKTAPRFGETTKAPATLRKTDRECKKIVENSIPPLDLHIIGGETASLGEFPHMVALGFERDNGYEFDCGGTLLSDTFVLTAAHCVDTLDRVVPSIARMGLVEIGASVFNEDTDVTVAEIIKHPEYTKREKYHDLALIRLSRPVQMNSYQNAACLYTSNSEPSTELTVTGWGTTSAVRNVRSRVLLKANVTLVDRNECSTSYTNWRKLPRGIAAEQLCAGDPERRRDTCQGDSGGPLQVLGADGQYRVLGITSFGRSCAGAAPGVYTRLTHYLDWIEGLVWPDK